MKTEEPTLAQACADLQDAWLNLLMSVLDALSPILVPILKGLVRLLDWLDERLGR